MIIFLFEYHLNHVLTLYMALKLGMLRKLIHSRFVYKNCLAMLKYFKLVNLGY